MSDSTSGAIEINAPVDVVVNVLADLASYPDWTEGMYDVEVLEDADGRPTRARFSVSGGPIRDTVDIAYAWDPNRVSWTLLKGNTITTMNGCYSWQAAGATTRVTYDLEIALSMTVPSFLKRAAEKTIVTTALQGLKKRAEGQR